MVCIFGLKNRANLFSCILSRITMGNHCLRQRLRLDWRSSLTNYCVQELILTAKIWYNIEYFSWVYTSNIYIWNIFKWEPNLFMWLYIHCLVNILCFQFQKSSFSSLHAAAESGSVECVRSILEAGANVDVVDQKNIHAAHL